MIRSLLSGTALLALAACATGPGQQPPRTDLSAALVPAKEDAPPGGPEGACWARDITPAVIETQTEQVMLSPAGAGGAASFRSVTRQEIVQDRRDVWFRTPCEADLTVAFVASLQRALKARGLYASPVTGTMDDATRLAIRRFQEPLGLDSEVLSLEAARALGLTAVDLDSL